MNIEEKKQEILSNLDGLTFTEIYEIIHHINKTLGYRFIDMIKWNNTFIENKIQENDIILEEPKEKEQLFVSNDKESKVIETPKDTFGQMQPLVVAQNKIKRKYSKKEVVEPKILKKLPTRKRIDFINYPEEGNWADKVFYAATCFKRPFRAREAADILLKKEDSIAPEVVIQRVGAYCSQMNTGVNPIFGTIKNEDGSALYYLLEDGNNSGNSEYSNAIKQ